MDDKPESGESRREEIEQRLAAIRTRIGELQAVRQDDASPGGVSERIGSAERQAAASQAAAEQAIAASIRAFRRAAEAHECAALQHERAAAAGFGDKNQHGGQAARHRAAAAVDIQRAERAQSLLQMKRPTMPADQALGQTQAAERIRVMVHLAPSRFNLACDVRKAAASADAAGEPPTR